MSKSIESELCLNKLVFEKILFVREGLASDNELGLEIQSGFFKNDDDIYKVVLTVNGRKEAEYSFEVSLCGFFSFESDCNLNDEEKNSIISKNTIAIMMPYMRSEISLLTAQPGVECVVLPPVNTTKIFTD